jgi:hypothetical protein
MSDSVAERKVRERTKTREQNDDNRISSVLFSLSEGLLLQRDDITEFAYKELFEVDEGAEALPLTPPILQQVWLSYTLPPSILITLAHFLHYYSLILALRSLSYFFVLLLILSHSFWIFLIFSFFLVLLLFPSRLSCTFSFSLTFSLYLSFQTNSRIFL